MTDSAPDTRSLQDQPDPPALAAPVVDERAKTAWAELSAHATARLKGSKVSKPSRTVSPILTAINDLWFEWGEQKDKGWPKRRGRGSAEFTRAVAQETRNALVRLLSERQKLLPPVETDDSFAVGFDSAIEVIRDVDI